MSGDFANIGGQARSEIARLDPVTAADSWDPNADAEVYDLAVQADGKILVGGDFTAIGGQARSAIARLDPVTGLADSWDPSAIYNDVEAIVVLPDGKILVGGFSPPSAGRCATISRGSIR